MDIILKISIILAVGMIGGKVANKLKLPNVSGYLIFGVLLGPSIFNLVTQQDAKSLDIINQLALAFIAFSIGSEFVYKDMKAYGKRIFIITLAEVVGAVGVVFFVMYVLFNQGFAISLVVASMSAATAPAATLLVMRQYRAYGPLTKTVLPVVALDDIFGIIVFGVALSVAKIVTSGVTPSFMSIVVNPLVEIVGSLLLGLVIGVALTFILKKIKGGDDLQVITLLAIGLGIGLSTVLNLSSLLTNIMVGTTIANLHKKPDKVFKSVNQFVPVFYVLFFTLAGASLDLNILKVVGFVGVGYIFARGLGKALGAWVGAKISKAEKSVVKYLGLCLLPQGGISIGLSVIVRNQFPEFATQVTTIIMFGVLVYETTGPIFSKIALSKAGEIGGLDRLNESEQVSVLEELESNEEIEMNLQGSES